MLLTLIRGKARKSSYMEIMHKGTNNSLFVQYGQEFPMLMPEGKEVYHYPRSEKTLINTFYLEEDLMELMANILDQTPCRYIYLYGNFGVHEIGAIRNVAQKVDGQLTIVVSIQDETVANGQIIFEEIR